MLKAYKGLEDLLMAMPAVLARFPRCRLLVAGEPLMPMAPIHQQIERLGLQRRGDPAAGLRPPRSRWPHTSPPADLIPGAPIARSRRAGVVVTAQGYAARRRG